MKWQIRPASPEDLNQVAALFLESFEETIGHFFKDGPPPAAALEDFFCFLLKEEPEAFWVARQEEKAAKSILGYIVVVADLPFLWRRAFLGGYVFHWAKRFLQGVYGVNIRVACRILQNKFAFWRHSRSMPQYCSQILSLAVTGNCRGKGLGRKLLENGILYLHKRGKKNIKLEVRPWNKTALGLYSSIGFKPAGTTRDSQGEWLVMVKTS
ncbi:MAG: GNAT family N-acetyltransferase [Firmicutes bacterium]|nr:GNAT family N-acetyltransferase [Bacillota bacterium]